MVQSIAKAADLDGTVAELKGVTGSLNEVGQTLSGVVLWLEGREWRCNIRSAEAG